MHILAIDTTSYLPKVALLNNNNPICEITKTSHEISWDDFREWDGSYIKWELQIQLNQLWGKTWLSPDTLDLICFSGYSWFRKAISQWKEFAINLWKTHTIQVKAIDHISSHDLSVYIEQEDIRFEYPTLVFSASWSHNSISILHDKFTLEKFSDSTEFDMDEKKYIWLGSIFFRLVKSLWLFDDPSWTNNISEIISKLEYKISEELLDILKKNYSGDLYTLHLCNVLDFYKENYIAQKKYPTNVLFYTFQEFIIQICCEKFLSIYEAIAFKQIHIVGGIAMNDEFFSRIKDLFDVKWVNVYRPMKKYRFDNATMLWYLAYLEHTSECSYDISEIVTE